MERKTGQLEGRKIENIRKHRCQNPKQLWGIDGVQENFQYDGNPIWDRILMNESPYQISA